MDAPASGDPLTDGLAFARWLGPGGVPGDDARAEMLLARAARSRVFVGMARMERQLLVVARLP